MLFEFLVRKRKAAKEGNSYSKGIDQGAGVLEWDSANRVYQGGGSMRRPLVIKQLTSKRGPVV